MHDQFGHRVSVVGEVEIADHGVVVGVDGSPVSEHALRFAAAEAHRVGEKLIAVSVWTPVEAPRNALVVYPELYLSNMQAATEEMLATTRAELEARASEEARLTDSRSRGRAS